MVAGNKKAGSDPVPEEKVHGLHPKVRLTFPIFQMHGLPGPTPVHYIAHRQPVMFPGLNFS